MATMQKISRETETKLLRSLEKVASQVQDGERPSDAIIKVARDDDMPIGHVQLMIQAYNNARYNQQRQSSSILSEKTAHFPLADPDVIYEALFPGNVKEAHARSLQTDPNVVSDEYTREPEPLEPNRFSMSPFTKEAKVLQPEHQHPHEPHYFMKRAHGLLKELENEHAEKRRLMSDARDKVAMAFGELHDYFSYMPLDRYPFPFIKDACIALHGEEARPIFDKLAEMRPKLNKEEVTRPYRVMINDPPVSLVGDCLEKVAEYTRRYQGLETFSKEAGEASYEVLSRFLPQTQQPLRGSLLKHREKRAFNVGMLASPVGEVGKHLMGQELAGQIRGTMEPKAPERLEQKSLLGLMDPAHEQKLRGIRAQAVFHDLMSNDEFLSGADPEAAAKVYNEVVKVSPRAADQPLLMRALLRRYMAQGTVDPADVQQLAEIEGKLKEREAPHEPQYPLPGM